MPACVNECHERFVENFDSPVSRYFTAKLRKNVIDNRYFQGVDSLSEKGTKIMLLRLDPEDSAGSGRGTEIISEKFIHIQPDILHVI